MEDPNFSRCKLWGSVQSPRGVSGRKPCKIIAICMFALLVICMLMGPGNIDDISKTTDSDEAVAKIRAYERSVSVNSAGISASTRNTSFSFLPKVINSDADQKSWWQDHQDVKVRAGRPKVLMVRGSQPTPCQRLIDTHTFLKSAKNKIHYSRMHDLQVHYTLMKPHKDVVGKWTELPILRMQMLAHPEFKWFWWMDSDIVIIDMEFELPLDRYEGHIFVIFGDEHRFLELKDWKGLRTGNFLIRNCQWSLHLLDAWASIRNVHQRNNVENLLSNSLPDRPEGMGADDQPSLVYVLWTEKALWLIVKPEKIEKLGRGDPHWPVPTHFSGCSRCGGREGAWPWDECQREMEQAMDFAENQVYRKHGYEIRGLGIPELVPVPGHVPQTLVASPEPEYPAELLGFNIHKLLGPKVENWDAQREAWLQKNPDVKKITDHGLPKTMMVTGSSTRECTHPVGGHALLQALENKVYYGRFHDMPMLYGQVNFDVQLEYWVDKNPHQSCFDALAP